MSHYYAEQMFNPVLVSPTFKIENSTLSKEEIEVYIVSEMLEELKNIRLEISVQRFDSLKETYLIGVPIGKFVIYFISVIKLLFSLYIYIIFYTKVLMIIIGIIL